MFLQSQTSYQRYSNGYTYVFGVGLIIGTLTISMLSNRKWTNPRWRPMHLQCMLLHCHTRYQRYSNGYSYVFGVWLPLEITMRPDRKWKNPSRKSPGNSVFQRGLTGARPAVEVKCGFYGGWGPMFHNWGTTVGCMPWWNEITIQLIRKLQSRTKD